MKIAIATKDYFGSALIDLLTDNGYGEATAGGYGDSAYLLVNTCKQTYKDGNNAGDRTVLDPTVQWSEIVATITSASGGSQAPTTAPAAARAFQVGDVVTAINKPTTAAKFYLETNRHYTVDRITPKGNLGLAGLPNDEYSKSRFTLVTAANTAVPSVAETNGIRVGDVVTAMNLPNTKSKFILTPSFRYTVANITPSGKINVGGEHDYLASRFTVVQAAPVSGIDAVQNGVGGSISCTATVNTVAPVDDSGNTLAIGDTVLVKQPDGKKPVFRLRPNGVAVITRITPKGALGFDFDAENTFLSKRFQKVTLSQVNTDGSLDGEGNLWPENGNLVVARPGRHRRNTDNAAKFALPQNTALTFVGTTSPKGNFILAGYNDHQYAPARFSVVTPVTPR